jgi:hypothetical protein
MRMDTDWWAISEAINNSVGFFLWTRFAISFAEFGLVVLLVGGIIGAALWFFFRRPKRDD